MAVINMLPQGGGLGDFLCFQYGIAKNGNGTRTYTSGTVTCSSASVKVIYTLLVTRYFHDDSAQSNAMSGYLKLQGSNNNSTWVDVKTMNYPTAIQDTSAYGTASGYKYYRFVFYCSTSGWGKAACGCSLIYK